MLTKLKPRKPLNIAFGNRWRGLSYTAPPSSHSDICPDRS